jgi:hypothetical protein
LTVALFLAAGAALGAGALAPVEAPPRAGAERGPRTTGAAAFLTGATVATCVCGFCDKYGRRSV